MTTLAQARDKVERILEELSGKINVELAVDDAATRSESWAWVFFYNSRAYIETGSFSHALAGNGPIVVERVTGQVHELTAVRPVDEQLEQLRRKVEQARQQ